MPNHELPTLLDELKTQATTTMRKVEKTDDVDADFINPIFRQLLINDKYTFEQMKAIMAMNFVNHLLKTKEKNLLEAINELFDKITKNSNSIDNVKETVDALNSADISAQTIEKIDKEVAKQLPAEGDSLKVVISKISKYLADLEEDYLGKTAKAADSDKLAGRTEKQYVKRLETSEISQELINNTRCEFSWCGDKHIENLEGLPDGWYTIQYFYHNLNGYGTQIFIKLGDGGDVGRIFVRTAVGNDWNKFAYIAKANTTNTFDGVQVFNNTIRSTNGDRSLEVRTIQGSTANGQDGNLYLNVYDPSKPVYFTTTDGVYHTLQELFQSLTDGKSTLISEFNKLLGYDSGLTAQNTFNDFAWWLKNKVIPSKIEKEIIVKKIEVNHVSHAGTNFTSGISKILFISQEFKETKRGTHFFSTVNFVPFENGVSVYPYSHHSFFLTATTHDLNDHNVLNLRPSDWESGTCNFDLFLIGIKKQ